MTRIDKKWLLDFFAEEEKIVASGVLTREQWNNIINHLEKAESIGLKLKRLKKKFPNLFGHM
jgi:hypothetical protein